MPRETGFTFLYLEITIPQACETPVSGTLVHETGFTQKTINLFYLFGNGLFPVYHFCSNLSLVLYCIAYAAGGPFSVAQKRGEKTLWPGLTRHACGRALNAGLFPVPPKAACRAARQSAVAPLRHRRQGHADSSPPLSINYLCKAQPSP